MILKTPCQNNQRRETKLIKGNAALITFRIALLGVMVYKKSNLQNMSKLNDQKDHASTHRIK